MLSQLSGTVLLGPQEPLKPPHKEAPLSRHLLMPSSFPSMTCLLSGHLELISEAQGLVVVIKPNVPWALPVCQAYC